VHAELAAQGIRVGRKRIARLMRAAGVQGVSRRKWVTTTTRDPQARSAPDLVQRNFHVAGADQLWVADITNVPTGPASSTSRSCSMRGAGGLSAGPWPPTCGPSWS
jgi:putative transposase